MKKAVCLVILLLALLVCAFAAADEIDIINSGRFPDPVFRDYVLSLTPAGNDGFLTDEVIDGITEISVNTLKISDLTGIEVFRNLTVLECDGGRLDGIKLTKGLDLSGLKKLKYLYCQNNQLPSLNVSGCSSLQEIQAYSNKISSLNISGCSSLQELDVFDNQLTSLYVHGLTALKNLSAHSNKLSKLDLSGCTSLTVLSVVDNKLTSLDISSCAKLNILNVSDNQFSSIDFSRCAASLEYLGVDGNKLTSLNVNSCKSLISLYCHNNNIASLDITNVPLIRLAYTTAERIEGLDEEKNSYIYSLDYDTPDGNTFQVDKSTVVIINNKVTFNANGGKGNMQPLSVQNGKAFNLPGNLYTRVGWKFTSWNTKKDGSGTSYQNKASITLNNEDLTLYAQWAKIKKISGHKLKALPECKIEVSWKKLTASQRKISKYVEVEISTSKSFKKILKTKRVKSSKTSCIFTGLKPGKRYYVRVRAYTKVGKAIHVSKWSSVKSIKTLKK